MLWLLLALPALVAAYRWVLRRRKRFAVSYPSLAVIKEAMGPAQRIRRHVPPALFLLALASVIFAIARPTAVVPILSPQQTLILAVDVSLSMRATDVDPNRITAAQAAAKAFIEELPKNVKIGLVAFAGTASLVQTPTDNKEELLAAIDRFQLQRATATGSAIIVSLAALFPDAGIDLESIIFGGRGASLDRGSRKAENSGNNAGAVGKPDQPKSATVPPGSYNSGAIILL